MEIGPNAVWKFATSFYAANHDSKNTSLIAANIERRAPQETRIAGHVTLLASCLALVVVLLLLLRRSKSARHGFSVGFLRRGMASNRDSFDLGRLLEDPEKSGFNRVSTHEVDADDADLSDSEVEEFNVSNVRNGLKV